MFVNVSRRVVKMEDGLGWEGTCILEGTVENKIWLEILEPFITYIHVDSIQSYNDFRGISLHSMTWNQYEFLSFPPVPIKKNKKNKDVLR